VVCRSLNVLLLADVRLCGQRPSTEEVFGAACQPEDRRVRNNQDYCCARWNTKKNTITLNAPNA
jgi:hypothetical protein